LINNSSFETILFVRSSKIESVWDWSLETEALRVLKCAQQIAVGFFRANNFYLQPYQEKNSGSIAVLFPDLPYHTILKFWDRVKKIKDVLPIEADPELVKSITKLLKKANFPQPDYQSTKNIWAKAQTHVISEINKIIPSRGNKIQEIHICPTIFGTSVSFSLLPKPLQSQSCWLIGC
jgi:hypothetical protein